MTALGDDTFGPIVIWPYNRGDSYFKFAQHERMQDLKSRRNTLTADEQDEWEALVELAFVPQTLVPELLRR